MSASRPLGAATVVALGLGVLGLVTIVVAALLPWLSTNSAVVEPTGTGPSTVLLALTGATAALGLVGHRRGLVVLAAILGTLALAAVCVDMVDPGHFCVDGIDGEGNPVGFCIDDTRTFAPVLFCAGAVATCLAAATAWAIAPRAPRTGA